MNFVDAAKLSAVLDSAGYSEADSEKQADIILVNTCVVRQAPEDRASAYINTLKGPKRRNPDLKIGVCGCLVSEPGRDLKKMFPHVDWFIPPSSPEILKKYINSSFVISNSSLGRRRGGEVVIMHGCDNFCSYCIVPYVRGRETSRPPDEVLAEIGQLLEQGAKTITLLGQNVNSYKYGLDKLLYEIQKFVISNSSFVINFLTSHPKDLSDELIQAVHDLPYVEKEFMMPLQSGDNEILKRMNRGYTLEHYLDRVNKIRSLMPQARIFSDILVGFPGETEEQFQNTLQAVKNIGFNMAHMFAYSDRPGTSASKLPGQIPEEVKQDRLKRLIDTVREVVRA
jgi:tRNA-2-methylthio-N6-dimethylallyladenosine synthase